MTFQWTLSTSTGWAKKYRNTKITISQKCTYIFVINFAQLFRRQLCKSMLLCAVFTWHRPDTKLNFRNEFCNCTDCTTAWFYYLPIAIAWHGTGYKITCVCLSVIVSVVAPTAAIFIRFSWNFVQWFGAWKVKSRLFVVKIRWPLPLFCPNFYPLMHFDTLRCWLTKIKHWIWCCTTSPNIN